MEQLERKYIKLEKIKKAIDDSECVLLGIGSAFKYIDVDIESMKLFKQKKNSEGIEQGADWLLPFLKSYSCQKQDEKSLLNAYNNIYQLVKGKNYFVVTLNDDDKIFQSEFSKEKITAPCGSMNRHQCIKGCEGSIKGAEAIVCDIIREVKNPKKQLGVMKRPCCEKCGDYLVFNTVEQEHYLESGYLESWERYRLWLTGTLNKKICLLELGVDFEYPSIIRWAFEKVAFLNEKAVFIRINDKYPQLAEELKGKSYSYTYNPVEFFQ